MAKTTSLVLCATLGLLAPASAAKIDARDLLIASNLAGMGGLNGMQGFNGMNGMNMRGGGASDLLRWSILDDMDFGDLDFGDMMLLDQMNRQNVGSWGSNHYRPRGQLYSRFGY